MENGRCTSHGVNSPSKYSARGSYPGREIYGKSYKLFHGRYLLSTTVDSIKRNKKTFFYGSVRQCQQRFIFINPAEFSVMMEVEGRRITNNDTCILHCTYRCEFLRKRKAPFSRTTVPSPFQTNGLFIPGILLWHHRSRHRLVLKSQEIIERRDLITLNLTAFVMSPCFKLNKPAPLTLCSRTSITSRRCCANTFRLTTFEAASMILYWSANSV